MNTGDKMAEQVKKPIKITETILRDAHQSLIATTYDDGADASDRGEDWIRLDIIL